VIEVGYARRQKPPYKEPRWIASSSSSDTAR
jgi:hypothetical protein